MNRNLHLIAVFAIASAAVLPVFGASEGLDSLEEINTFVGDLTPRRVPFKLTGRVLSAFYEARATEVILTDDAGTRAEFFICDPNVPPPVPGDTIEAFGLARFDENHEHYMRLDAYTVLEHGTPPEPIKVRLSETNAAKHHLAIIQTEGTVIDTFPDEIDRRYEIVLLKDNDVVIPVSLPHKVFGDVHNLIDAQIRITGVYHRFVSGIRKFGWPSILLHTPEDLMVLTQPPQDPFSVPSLEQSLYLTSEEIARMTKRSVVGEVLATWSTDQAMVRESDGRIVNLTLANSVALPPLGAVILAAGQPETDLFRINLTAARWKATDASLPPESEEEPALKLNEITFLADGEPLSIWGGSYGKLLSLEGIVRTLPTPNDGNRFVLDTGSLEVPVDVSATPTIAAELAIGCRIRAVGRCIFLADTAKRVYGSSKVKGIALILREPSDIHFLSRPSWWTPARLLVLIALLLLALVGVAIWTLIQRHFAHLKILERTRLAVEIHDTLSQNLAGVACQVSAGNFALDEDPKSAKTFINSAENMLQSCRTELRNCLFDLRSDMLEEPDFGKAILKALNQLTYETSVAVRFHARRADFSDPSAHAILSVIRELTANAIRHGHASNVRIAGLAEDGKLFFSVTDNGSGFDPQHCAGIPEGHFGISGIRDRLKRLNGTITFTSTPGKGAKATVSLPLPRK